MYICYDKPASPDLKGLNEYALPLGNGKIGAKIFGGVENEMICFNDGLLYSGSKKSFGSYQAMGELIFSFGDSIPFNENSYVRDLDLSTASAMVACQKGVDGVNKHFFISEKDNVLIGKIESTGDNLLDFSVSLQSEQNGEIIYNNATAKLFGSVNANNGIGKEKGKDANLIKYGCFLCVLADDGKIETSENDIHISDCFSCTVFLSTHCCFDDGDPLEYAEKNVNSCKDKDFKELFITHLEEYRKGIGKIKLNLGQTDQNCTTEKLLKVAQKGKFLNEILVTLFEYGLYIYSSSCSDYAPISQNGIWNGLNCPEVPIGIDTSKLSLISSLARYSGTQNKFSFYEQFSEKYPLGIYNIFGCKSADVKSSTTKKGLFAKTEVNDLPMLRTLIDNKDEKKIEKILKSIPSLFSGNLIPKDIFNLISYSEAVLYMLCKENDDVISLIEFLPKMWQNGSVKGIETSKAVVSFEWDNLHYKKGELVSKIDGNITLFAGGKVILVYDENGNDVPCSLNNKRTSFVAEKGKKYLIA